MKSDQELYRQLRDLPKERLWSEEVARFDAAEARERLARVAVIRAAGMVFARFGTPEERVRAREWLLGLLADPQEKVRRYAAAALPKIGGGREAEARLLELLQKPAGEREVRHAARALEKVGGAATLAAMEAGEAALPALAAQKVRAAVARTREPGAVRLDAPLPLSPGQRVHLRCRRGLEDFVRDEAEQFLRAPGLFRLADVQPGRVTVLPTADFTLATLYQLRCFATVGLELGRVRDEDGPAGVEALARCLASPRARGLLRAGSDGTPRYRLEFTGRGHQRGAIRQVTERAHALCPDLLNDPRQAPWSVDVIPDGDGGSTVELRPRLHPDPRLAYRQDDVPAASHPPLAAAMARLAGPAPGEVVWDPFCGSGLELVERTRLGGVSAVLGTDLDPAAIAIARANFAASEPGATRGEFVACDFRDAPRAAGLRPESVSLIITNPPLGRRVRIPDLQGLFREIFAAAAWALAPGGRLVFTNPLRLTPRERSLQLEYRQPVDLGGFECRLEMYRKWRE